MKKLLCFLALVSPLLVVVSAFAQTSTIPYEVTVDVVHSPNGVTYTYTVKNNGTDPIYAVDLGVKNDTTELPLQTLDGSSPRRAQSFAGKIFAPKGTPAKVVPQEESFFYSVIWELGHDGLAPGKKITGLTNTPYRPDAAFETCDFMISAGSAQVAGTATKKK